MDNPILPSLFIIVLLTALMILLWTVVLPITKDQLKPKDQGMGKFFIFVFSFLLFGLIVHYGSSVICLLSGSVNPL
jgi:hypothetical protein